MCRQLASLKMSFYKNHINNSNSYFKKFTFLILCVYAQVHVWHSMHVEVRGQLCES